MTVSRVAVLGTGLVGASIALAAGERLGATVSGWDQDPRALDTAAAMGALQPRGRLEETVADAELVFVCTPVSSIGGIAAEALRSTDGVVTDVGSAKASVLADVDSALAAGKELRRFVGGHPMTGSERSGPEAASATLLDGAVWVLTPTERTAPESVRLVEDAVQGCGAQPVHLTADRHDRMVAIVSHLPQLASIALMETASWEGTEEPETLMLAAGGFRDLTRLAASSPELWTDILLANRQEVATAVRAFAERLEELVGFLENDRDVELAKALEDAKRARISLGAKPTTLGVAVLSIPIPDRPGALADMTSILGERSVNIEDLEIVHSADGARGAVHLTVGASLVDEAAAALEDGGYQVARLA